MEVTMWTLIIFTLFGNAGTGGGMSTTVATVQFASQDLCTKAETVIKDRADIGPVGSFYQIFGKCVQTEDANASRPAGAH
jgi:hypothetical protein